MPNHSTVVVFCSERRSIHHVAIGTVIVSHVKICFRAKAHLVFRWCYNCGKLILSTVTSNIKSFQQKSEVGYLKFIRSM